MRRFKVDLEDGQLAGIAFGDPVRPVDALFLHANGFNAMTYQSILAPLGLRAHVAAIDLRGHGRSTVPADPSKLQGWNPYRDDVIAAIEQLAPKGTVLAGHSMGATVSILVAGKRTDLVTGLVLADPVLFEPGFYSKMHWPGMPGMAKKTAKMSKQARKRRSEFESQSAAVEALTGRGAFKTWRTPFLDDYVTDGVTQTSDPDVWRLSCEPEWEAANFGAQRIRPWGALKKVEAPTVLIRAEKRSTCPRTAVRRFMRTMPEAVLIEPSGTSHFLPMERPYAVRDSLSEFLARYVEGFAAGEEGRVQRNLSSTIGEND
ncbi:MAG: alpha/beta hydrolase [Ponticaulis sp.]|nr:alpha/beta hydrolase [Ponticaulis sp.]